jgi:F-type H+-transporting ATPase subunit b
VVNCAGPRGVTACETSRKLCGLRLLLALVALAALIVPAAAAGQPAAHEPQAAPESAHAASDSGEAHGTAGEHAGASPWDLAGKLVNFGLLAGTLVYLLRRPMSTYLADRGVQVRRDLEQARQMKEDATRQIAEIEAKLAQLPSELDTLRTRGREEIAAEEARINDAAEAERARLLDQTRREIDQQLRIARRDLIAHAADLSIQVARNRIRREITDADQQRLVERYLDQVQTHE